MSCRVGCRRVWVSDSLTYVVCHCHLASSLHLVGRYVFYRIALYLPLRLFGVRRLPLFLFLFLSLSLSFSFFSLSLSLSLSLVLSPSLSFSVSLSLSVSLTRVCCRCRRPQFVGRIMSPTRGGLGVLDNWGIHPQA